MSEDIRPSRIYAKEALAAEMAEEFAEPAAPTPVEPQTWDALSRQCTSSAKQSGQISDDLYDRALAAYEKERHPSAPQPATREARLDCKWCQKPIRLVEDHASDGGTWIHSEHGNRRCFKLFLAEPALEDRLLGQS